MGTVVLYHSLVFLISIIDPFQPMKSKDVIKEHINHLLSEDCIYTKRVTEVFNVEINQNNFNDLATLINLLEIHEEALKQIRKVLLLKQGSHLMSYMATYARTLTSE